MTKYLNCWRAFLKLLVPATAFIALALPSPAFAVSVTPNDDNGSSVVQGLPAYPEHSGSDSDYLGWNDASDVDTSGDSIYERNNFTNVGGSQSDYSDLNADDNNAESVHKDDEDASGNSGDSDNMTSESEFGNVSNNEDSSAEEGDYSKEEQGTEESFDASDDLTTGDGSETIEKPEEGDSATGDQGDVEPDEKPEVAPPVEGIDSNKTYIIQSGVNGNQVLDVAGGSTSDGSNVQIYESNMSAAQKWQFVYENGFYTIHLAGTDKVLDVAGALAADGANVQIWTANGTDAQLWHIIKQGNAYIFVSKLNPNLVLDLFGGGTGNGTNVQIWTANQSNAQSFHLVLAELSEPVAPGEELPEDGSYIIVAGSENGNTVVDVSAGSTQNGANIQLWENNGSNAQKFYFKYDGQGYYTIYSISSGKALDVSNGNMIPGANVQQWDAYATLQQKWALHKNDDGSYSFINAANGQALDIFGGLLANGSNIQTYTANGSLAQKFWLRLCDNPAAGSGTIIEDGEYVIESSSNLVMVVEVANGLKNDGANVQIYQSNMTGSQRWTFTRYGNSEYYTIGLSGTDKVLDVDSASVRDGANVHIFTANGSDAQLWKLVEKDGTYMLVSKIRPDLVIDLFAGGVTNGTNVQVYSANGSVAQRFYLRPFVSDLPQGVTDVEGSFLIVAGSAPGGNYVADIAAGSLGNGANAQIFEKNESGAQRYYFNKNADGTYSITVVGTGKVLDVKDGNIVATTNVQQWENNGSDAQKWILIENEDGSYTIINKANGLALDVANGQFANGSNLQVFFPNGSASQKFWLKEIAAFSDGIYTINPVTDPNKVFDVAAGSSASGAVIQIYDSNNTLAQRFKLIYNRETDSYWIRTAASGGVIATDGSSVIQVGSSMSDADTSNGWKLVWNGTFFSLANRDGLVISLGAAGTANGAGLTIADMNGSSSQHFLFLSTRLIADGLYEIHSGKDSSLNLDIVAGSSASGANVQVYTDNNSVAQKFYIISYGNSYIIKNFVSQKVLDVDSGSQIAGANVHQWEVNHSNAQLWNADIADGGGIAFLNVGSGLALTVAQNNNVYQDEFEEGFSRSQAWTIEVTQGYGWVSRDGVWFFYYKDGTSQSFSNAAYSAYQAIQNWTSKTNYLICVDNDNFRTIVFKGSAGNWEPIKDWICSVGTTNKHDPTYGITARGVFEVLGKGYIMGNDPDYYYWTEFFIPSGSPDGEGQRFHSTGYYRGTGYPGVPYDTTIGHAETHGCVRLELDNAKWIYDFIPLGTLVYIYPSA